MPVGMGGVLVSTDPGPKLKSDPRFELPAMSAAFAPAYAEVKTSQPMNMVLVAPRQEGVSGLTKPAHADDATQTAATADAVKQLFTAFLLNLRVGAGAPHADCFAASHHPEVGDEQFLPIPRKPSSRT